jgi:tryptophan halogenase
MPEAAAYNRGLASHVANVRDFQLTHHVLNQRFDDPVWDRARAVSPPETLAAKLRKFAARGVINLYDDESFQPQNWTAIFLGHGLIPKAWDPLIEAVPVEEQMAKTQGLLARIAEEVRAMPALADQLGRG